MCLCRHQAETTLIGRSLDRLRAGTRRGQFLPKCLGIRQRIGCLIAQNRNMGNNLGRKQLLSDRHPFLCHQSMVTTVDGKVEDWPINPQIYQFCAGHREGRLMY